MGILSKFENRMEDGIEGGGTRSAGATLSVDKIVKRAEKEMRRQKESSAGRNFAPTLYTVLVSPFDQDTMFSRFPAIADEAEGTLRARARELALAIEGKPLVRFIADPELKKGKFDVVAEAVSQNVLEALRHDEMVRYGLVKDDTTPPPSNRNRRPDTFESAFQGDRTPDRRRVKSPYSVEDAIAAAEYAIDYAEHYSIDTSKDIYDGKGGIDSIFLNENISRQQSSKPARACLHDSEHHKMHNLFDGTQTIGRESSNNISVPDINISRRHAQISYDVSGVWKIVDLNSTNGVFVNGVKVESATLKDKDEITLGTTKLKFETLD